MWFMLSDYSNSECGAKIWATGTESEKICYTLAHSLLNGGRFLQHDTMLARYMLWPCVCLSVCLAVTHRRVVDYSKSKPTDDKPSLKEAWSGSRDTFKKFEVPCLWNGWNWAIQIWCADWYWWVVAHVWQVTPKDVFRITWDLFKFLEGKHWWCLGNGTRYRHSYNGRLTGYIICGLSNGTNRNDLEWPWRSLLLFEIFQTPILLEI